MSLRDVLKGADALLECEDVLAANRDLAGAALARNEAVKRLRTTLGEFREQCGHDGICRRVLVAVDASRPARWALQAAVSLARFTGARVALVHAVHNELSAAPDFAMWRGDLAEELRLAGQELLDQLKSHVPAELQPETFLLIGDPADQIMSAARMWDADLIVMGTHGRDGVAHMLIGSTAEGVVRHAPCPVLTVGHDLAEAEAHRAAHSDELAAPIPPPAEKVNRIEGELVN